MKQRWIGGGGAGGAGVCWGHGRARKGSFLPRTRTQHPPKPPKPLPVPARRVCAGLTNKQTAPTFCAHGVLQGLHPPKTVKRERKTVFFDCQSLTFDGIRKRSKLSPGSSSPSRVGVGAIVRSPPPGRGQGEGKRRKKTKVPVQNTRHRV